MLSRECVFVQRYLNAGGRIVVLGNTPLLYHFDSTGNVTGFDFTMMDSVLDIHLKANDLRSMGGIQPAFATNEGKRCGLSNSWTSFIPLDDNQIDVVLGKDENGKVSSWIKKYNAAKNSGFIQIWIDPDFVDDMSSIVRVAEFGMND